MPDLDFDIAVIGGGPGGYVAAIRAGQLGKRVVLFERERVGGLCLNWGCIPSKTLLHFAEVVNYVREADRFGIAVSNPTFDLGVAIDESRLVVDRLVSGVEGLLRSAGVTVINAPAQLTGATTIRAGDADYTAETIIIATGAETRPLRSLPFDGERIISSREALLVRTPPQRAIIVGSGPVGMEFAQLWSSYGTNVTVVEMLDRLLPNEDADVSRELAKAVQKRGITAMVNAKVTTATVNDASVTVEVETADGTTTLEADVVMVAIGFVPHTAGLGLEAADVATDERGFITIDDTMRTNIPTIYAIGDVTGRLMLAHVAMQQGTIAAEHIAGEPTPALDYIQMPRVTFTEPQVGSVGYTEAAARDAGFDIRTARFPFSALGRAIAIGQTTGFVKVVVENPTGQLLGIHVIGHDASSLIGQASLAALMEATTAELGFAVAAHPTFAEALKEAALAADGAAIHIAQRKRSQQ